MNYLSVNIRGTGVDGKDAWVRDMVKANEVDFLVMQETKTQGLDRQCVERFWGRGSFEFEVVDPTGLSGGLVSIWDSNGFVKDRVVKNRNFLLVGGRLRKENIQVNVVNIYGPKSRAQKAAVWQALKALMAGSVDYWVLMGDYNTVRSSEERLNTGFNEAMARDFNEFIEEAGLVEYPLNGRKFTFLAGKGKGDKQSRIDRALVCSSMFGKWPSANLRALPRRFSDHCPLLLHMVSKSFGPKPFRWFNSWIEKEGCKDVVRTGLGIAVEEGSAQVRLFRKLKLLSFKLKEWHGEVVKNENEEINLCGLEIDKLEKQMEVKALAEEDLWILEECKNRLNELNLIKTKDLKQRSRVQWATMGDENSGFFHRVINGRRCSNNISGLEVKGEWITKPALVKREILRHFREHFSEDCSSRPSLLCDNVNQLTEDMGDKLIQPFSKEEIKRAAFDCGKDKAAGPDGFNFHFVQEFWELLEEDFIKILFEFYDTGFISPECGLSFITLVPKCKNPTSMKEYRPINLIGMVNKVISKLLANRIKEAMGEVISESQSAFLKDRYILDGPLVVNEVLAWLKRKDKKAFLLKIDFEKAYDNVNWGFLISMLEQMNFPPRWCMWVLGSLKAARSSVLVNGSPTFEFGCQKGLRQGDPLSPFLFLVVMEALSLTIKKAINLGDFKGIELDNEGMIISHLLYADDALILGNWSSENVFNLARLLRCFHICSGLKININKSNLYGVGSNNEETEMLAGTLGCKSDTLPFDYLGIKVGANMNRSASWKKVVDVFESRLATWKARMLSIGGRVVLIKAVLESLPIYYFSLYKAPRKVIETLERIMRKFLWTGSNVGNKVHWVCWDRVTTPKKYGGLGIKRLEVVNEALLFKWAWRFRTNKNALWSKIMEVCHKNGNMWEALPVNKYATGCWKAIVKVVAGLKINDVALHTLIRAKVGNGSSVRFWLDVWLGDCAFRDKWPLLFRLEDNKTCAVADRAKVEGNKLVLTADWVRNIRTTDELSQWLQMWAAVNGYISAAGPDQWSWAAAGHDRFTVKGVTDLLLQRFQWGSNYVMKWAKWVPLKCSIMAWRAEQNRLPTRVALVQRSIVIQDRLCPWCRDVDETVTHVLADCLIAARVWDCISSWCRIPPIFAFNIQDLLQVFTTVKGCKWKKKIVHGIVIVTMWAIWNQRNETIFRGMEPSVENIVSMVKSLSFLWLKNRTRYRRLVWKDWSRYPLYIL